MRKSSLFLIVLNLLSPIALAGEGDADAREQCRALVSGTYLGFMNDLDVLKSHLSASQESGFSLRARKGVAQKELEGLEKTSEAKKIPAADLDENILGVKASIEMTTQAIEDTAVRVAEIKDQIAAKEKSFKSFQEKLKPVFQVVNAKIVSQGAYPIKLEYKHPCNDFQKLCPLPKAMSDALIQVAGDLSDGTACTRYGSMR